MLGSDGTQLDASIKITTACIATAFAELASRLPILVMDLTRLPFRRTLHTPQNLASIRTE